MNESITNQGAVKLNLCGGRGTAQTVRFLLTSAAMNFPLQLRFKVLAPAPQIFVTDATNNEVFFVKQKLLKLRDAINVFSDHNQTRQVATIQADRIVDFSARFHFTDASGPALGSVGRRGS